MSVTANKIKTVSPGEEEAAELVAALSARLADLQQQTNVLKKNILQSIDKQKVKRVKSFINSKTL